MFHYLGPSFAVLLFARVPVLGVAWLRIASAAVIFAIWRRPWRALREPLVLAWGATLAAMNCCFYEAIARLPLGTVAAIEFLPVIALAALGARSARNAVALALAVGGVALLSDVQLTGSPLGFAFALANAALFALYIVLAHRAARHRAMSGLSGLGAAMLVALVLVTPAGGWQVLPVLGAPLVLLAGVGVGISSSVIPYVTDQLAMARLPRSTYSLMVALLPATAVVVGVIVLGQVPGPGRAPGGRARDRRRRGTPRRRGAGLGGRGLLGLGGLALALGFGLGGRLGRVCRLGDRVRGRGTGHACQERPRGPFRTAPLAAQRRVHGRRTGTGLGQREDRGDQHDVVLVAAVSRPRPVLEVSAVDRGQHRRGQDRGRDRRRGAERNQRTAAGFGGSRGERVALAGPQAEGLEPLGGALEAVAAEPAEELLGAVSDEETADGEAEKKASDFHRAGC